MRFKNRQNEIFWKNLLKHNLTRHEIKVLIAFVVDAPDYPTSIAQLHSRTKIQKPHISRALNGLRYQEIIFKLGNTNRLNELMLVENYVPKFISSSAKRRVVEKEYKSGSGNFLKQSELKKEKDKVANQNIGRMLKETQLKKTLQKGWDSYFSKIFEREIWYSTDNNGNGGFIRYCRSHPSMGSILIPPIDLVEEICRIKLKLTDPQEMIPYLSPLVLNEFLDKYKIKLD